MARKIPAEGLGKPHYSRIAAAYLVRTGIAEWVVKNQSIRKCGHSPTFRQQYESNRPTQFYIPATLPPREIHGVKFIYDRPTPPNELVPHYVRVQNDAR